MSFKENLKQKIAVDRLAERVHRTLGASGSGKKIDKEAMRTLLKTAGYQSTPARDMEIYRADPQAEKGDILVLDNELPLYHTTLKDVLLRKNPMIKEMVNIFNMKKILSDADVKVAKGGDTLDRIHAECLQDIDLTYTEADIQEIAADGRTACKNEASAQVEETLDLFAEILSFTPPPVPIRLPGMKILGRVHKDNGRVTMYGPVITYYPQENSLKFFDAYLAPAEMKKTQVYLDMVGGKETATVEGGEVFDALKNRVLKEAPQFSVPPPQSKPSKNRLFTSPSILL
ncbi:MAG: hypothetical protein U5L07_12355 [Desulfobacterales bacterium]|nr:hypothetical protein [Desulfobacterales bacterium]